IIMPPIGILLGGVNFSDLRYTIMGATVNAAGKAVPPVTINYGNFIEICVSFLIIALAIFVFVVKPMNAMKKRQAVAPATPEVSSKEEILLSEIRDLLKK